MSLKCFRVQPISRLPACMSTPIMSSYLMMLPLHAAYSAAFDEAWNDGVNEKAFVNAALSEKKFPFSGKGLPKMSITFSPHANAFALSTLTNIANRVVAEKSSVLFAIMDTDPTVKGPVIPAILKLHKQQKIFSYGISDSVNTISLYKPNTEKRNPGYRQTWNDPTASSF